MITIKKDTPLMNMDGTTSKLILGVGDHNFTYVPYKDGLIKCKIRGKEYLLEYEVETKEKK